MEVLTVGAIPPVDKWEKIITCKECKAKLKVCAADLKNFFYYGTHFCHYYVGISCSLCGTIAMIDAPKPIADSVKGKPKFDGYDDSL
jgi:hypothetical protein